MSVHMAMHGYIHAYTHVCTHIYTHVDADCLYTWPYTWLWTCRYTCLRTCLCTCLDTCPCTCPYTCIDWRKAFGAGLDDDGTVTAVMELRAKGAFYELLELDDYPFDVQPLTISLQTARIWGSNLPKFVVARQQGDDQGKDPIVHPTDWAYCMCKASQEQTGEDSAECYVTLHFSLVVKRRSFVQVFRVIVANACFALVSCLGFTFPRSDAGERVALSVTMLLTGIPEAVVVFVKATDFRGNGFEGSEISISGKFHVTLISI